MKCLVTGGNGFIGSHIVDRLVSLNHEVIVIDDLSAPENEEFYYNDEATYHEKDISTDDCEKYFADVKCVFHLAARSRIQPTIGSPNRCFEVNTVGTQRVLEWSRKNGVSKVVYSGTSSLYGHDNTTPFKPNMPADCLNPYSMSKWMGEQICRLYKQLYGIETVVLRYFNVYGPREPVKGHYAPVIGLFKRQFKEGVPLTVVGDGNQRRDFTYIDDVVNANIIAMNQDNFKRGVYNVGTGINYSINDLAVMIAGKEMKTTTLPNRPAEVRETLADIRETTEDLGWAPKVKLENAILNY